MKKINIQKKETKGRLLFKTISVLMVVVMLSFIPNNVFGAELLVVEDNLYRYVDVDASNTINLEDQIILDGEVFNVMYEANGVIYALSDKPLNSNGDSQQDDSYKTSHTEAKTIASKYEESLINKGLNIVNVRLLKKKEAINYLGFEIYNSSTNISNGITYEWYQKSNATPEFAYKYDYWLYDSQTYSNPYAFYAYKYYGSYLTNKDNDVEIAVLPVVEISKDDFGKKFKIICNDSGVSVSNINNEIHIEVEAKEGFVLDSMKAYDSKSNEISIVDNKFMMIRDDVTIETTYKEVYKVTFNVNGGSQIADLKNVVSGSTIKEPTAPTKENYTFVAWYKDEELQNVFNFSTDTITENTTLYAKWKENQPTTYTVTFNTNGGSQIANLTNVVSGSTIEEPTEPTKENYTFAGWYKDEELQNIFDFTTDTIIVDTTLYAKWEEEQVTMYEIVVSATPIAGGTVNGGETYEANELVTVEATANDGYTFVKWTENGVDVSTNATYTFIAEENRILMAVFEGIPKKIIVTFDSNGGSNVESYEFEGFGLYPQIPKPANPTRAGYTFNGWYKDGIEFDFNTTITESITLVAKWTKNQSTGGGGSTITKYKITVKQNENGKISPETIKVKKGANQKFEIKADKGYEIEDILVDGKSIGIVKEYTFEKVKETHTIEAIFKPTKAAAEDVWKNPFVDVNENDWFYNTVRFVNENKLFNGISNTEFGGNVSMTRGMLVAVLYRIEGEPAINKSIPFVDVDMSMYYASAISWAKQNSIVNGVDENNFAPDVQISREQLTAILYRYAQYKAKDVSAGENTKILSYDDFNKISEYAIPAMRWAIEEGIITGRTTTTLVPQGIATRAEVATMIMRFSNTLSK